MEGFIYMKAIVVLDIPFPVGTDDDWIHPVVLRDENHLVLVDCGYTGAFPLIETALNTHGISPEQLTHVVITHQDHDHMGGLFELKSRYPQVRVVASKIEAPYISGEIKSVRLAQAEALQAVLPPDQQAFGEKFLGILRAVRPVNVDETVTDGQELPWCGGCKVMATPGHTAGHISLSLPNLKTVISGDAAVIENKSLVIANPQFTLDPVLAQRSLELLKDLGAEQIICYHGGIWRADARP
jgi:glyoxylase-like metal-dependent hydrolase (beta-lactamase superfamily II)